MMNYQEFLAWLETERQMSKRSAKDVVSRLKRVVGLLGSDTLDSTSVSKLNEVAAFDEKGEIGNGVHTRYIIDALKFMAKLTK